MARSNRRSSALPKAPLSADARGWPTWVDPLAVQTLRESLRSPSGSHALLISGPRGVGKAALALAFGQAVACTEKGADPSLPCGTCRACRNVALGAHPDIEWFDLDRQAALAEKPARGANLSIETVRRLRASASLLPLESRRRLLIVDDAETMHEPAQQALLKVLEEPPPAVTLVLLADEPEVLLETVRSRCQAVLVRPVPESVIERELVGRDVDIVLAGEIAALSRGRPSWANEAARDPRLLKARRDERDAAVSWLVSTRYDRLVTAFRLGEQFGKKRTEVIGVVQAATQLLREAMIETALGQSPAGTNGAVFSESGVSIDHLGRAAAASLQCLADLDANVRPRLALEAMVLAWPNSESP